MKKIILLPILSLVFQISFSQTTVTPTTPSKPFKELIVKTWKFEGSEVFQDYQLADSTEKNDMIRFNADGTYSKITKGISSNGTWTLNESYKQLYLTDSESGKQTMYMIKKLIDTMLTISSQTPELVTTKFKYTAQ